MKTFYKNKYFIKLTLIGAFLTLIVQTNAQTPSFMGSSVKMSTEVNGNICRRTNDSTFISLNEESNTFTSTISLLPLVNSANKEDSLSFENNLLDLTFIGQFPIEDLSFNNFDKNDNTIYKMIGLLTANGITNPYTLIFALRTLLETDPTEGDVKTSIDNDYYSAKISFSITINPADFNLDIEPFAFKKEVAVEVIDGIINKQYHE